MSTTQFLRLLSAWLLALLGCPLSLLYMHSEIRPGAFALAAVKLGLVWALVSAAGVAMTHLMVRRWTLASNTFEEFVAALPDQVVDLPDSGPGELRSLSRSLRAMSDRVLRLVEHANLESSRRETILAGMAEGVLAVDPEMRVIFCNDAFAESFSTRVPLGSGRSLYEVVREPELRRILQTVLHERRAKTDCFQLPSAAGRWFEARALPLGDEPIRGAVIVLHDITDIQRQEQLRKDFVADVSHELRTPLAAIRGYAETLLDGALDDRENNRRFVEIILAHAIRLNNIASDLLVLSELDRNERAATPAERISVVDVIDSAMSTVQRNATARGIVFDRSLCSECSVTGYRHRLEQVVVNLLDNAIKFNRPDGEVSVECGYAPDGRVRISVADTGIGMRTEDLKRIFERFYRADKARSRLAGGTGLGLPIVKEVVERMGGTVSVESQLGRGSRFTVLLPAS